MRSTPEPKRIYLVFCLTLVQGQLDSKEEMNQHIYDEANAAFDGYETRLHRGENFLDVLASDINAEHRENADLRNDEEEINTNLLVQHENELEYDWAKRKAFLLVGGKAIFFRPRTNRLIRP